MDKKVKSNPLSNFFHVEPLRSDKQFQELQAAHDSDPPHEAALWPSHLCRKNGEVTGYFSLFTAPFALFWSHSKKHTAVDTLRMINFAENLARHEGRDGVLIPVGDESPMLEHMERLGYKLFYKTNLYHKAL